MNIEIDRFFHIFIDEERKIKINHDELHELHDLLTDTLNKHYD